MKKFRFPPTAGSLAVYAVFGLFAFLAVFPLLWMTLNSLKTNTEIFMDIFALPKTPQFINYVDAWRIAKLGEKIRNTLLYTSSSTFLILLLASMLAYAFAKLPFRRITALLYGSLGLGMLITLQAILIPLFVLMRVRMMVERLC